MAVTDWLALISTVQVLDVPLHAPPHPPKDEVDPGVAVSVTLVPRGKLALQVCGQLIPPESLVTVPVPVPDRLTVSVAVLWIRSKIAVACWLALRVIVQVRLVPLHAPAHPAKVELLAGVAVSVTEVPGSKLALHDCPQLMPEGVLATLPLPVPLKATANTGEALKLAITEVFCVSVTLQTPVPLQAPDHPAKKKLAAGDAVSVTWVPLEKLALQDWPQLMPAGLLLTVPPPPPTAWTLS